MKKTAIIGASNQPGRFATMAAQMLLEHQHEIVPLSIKSGQVKGVDFLDLREKPAVDNIDTVTLYLNPSNQKMWESYILSLNPKRIIFNPGTENTSLREAAILKGIEVINACTLVMLTTSQY